MPRGECSLTGCSSLQTHVYHCLAAPKPTNFTAAMTPTKFPFPEIEYNFRCLNIPVSLATATDGTKLYG
jgi:hypothetical protein